MTRKRTILVILGAFILGALCGGGGAMLVAAKQAAANQENAVGFLEGLDLGTLVDQCKPAEARYIPARNRPRTRDDKADNQQTALPSKAIQVQWAGETSRMTLLDKVVTQLRLHFQKQGYL